MTIETTEIVKESSATLIAAQSFKIATAPQYQEAGDRLKAIMALKKKIADVFDPHIKRAFEAHRSLVAEKKFHETPLQTAEAFIKRGMLGYQQAEEQKRRAEQAKLEEEARKEREKLEAQAARAAEKGKAERAEVLQAKAAAVVAPIIAPTTPKVSGISMRTTYRAEVFNKEALVEAAAGGRRRSQIAYQGTNRRSATRVPLIALDANRTFLNQQARAMNETLDYPGVRVVQETGIASRAGM